ncbi:uncharacterized protein LOC132285272 [Cornus florida]|uniref:uncharacterized protein LOC132285272 n=1 Tax=Cornus florida TaxID=4283 RepID=UPI00289F7743|nr:uncharacterized protein LOC132285272 [Cornus florida]
MIADHGNADQKWRMEEEDGLRIVECLRGRLLAERVASRVAKEDAKQMENKLIELENQLKAEIRSRNRAEKKLIFLIKKLKSLNILYALEDSEHSKLLDKSDTSSLSSTTSSSPKASKSQMLRQNLNQNVSQTNTISIDSNQTCHNFPI